MDHCCLAGCVPRSCGCCVRMPFHRRECTQSPGRLLEEARARAEAKRREQLEIPDNIILGEN